MKRKKIKKLVQRSIKTTKFWVKEYLKKEQLMTQPN